MSDTPAPRIEALTGLRFFAAVAVVLWHSQNTDLLGESAFAPFNLAGAVSLFFILSGYVLTLNADKYSHWGRFFVARFARVWPSHVVALLLWMAIFFPYSIPFIQQPSNMRHFLLNLLLMQAWSPNPETYYSYNSPSWSVSCEMFFYFAFPLCLLLLRRWPLLTLAAAGSAVVALMVGLGTLQPELSPQWLGYVNPVVNLPVFMVGIVIALLSRRLPPARIGMIPATVIQVATILITMWGNDFMANVLWRPVPTVTGFIVTNSGACWCYALLIFVLGRYHGVVSRLLAQPAFVYLGELSYGIYLFHFLVFRWYFLHHAAFVMPFAIQYAALCAAILGIAALVHHLVELPAQKLIRRAGRKRYAVIA
jgi:peptidoglycan/LPS O-acetylase OafA/YrhL